jgi:hypothetical protein
MSKVTQQHTREHNRTLTLKTGFAHDSVSRAKTSRITKQTQKDARARQRGVITMGGAKPEACVPGQSR